MIHNIYKAFKGIKYNNECLIMLGLLATGGLMSSYKEKNILLNHNSKIHMNYFQSSISFCDNGLSEKGRENDKVKINKIANINNHTSSFYKPDIPKKQPKINGLKIFSGNANLPLAKNIADLVGVNLGKITVERFADGEVNVMVHENVRGKDVYIVQPTCNPVNENLMELLLMVSTMRRASARRITAVIPYYGYARQDRKMAARVPISAADVARLLEAMGVDRVIAVDLHCGQIQGFFGPRVPVDNLDGGLVGVSYFGEKIKEPLVNPVVVSPDAGGVARAKKFREWLVGKYDIENAGLAMIIKQRVKANEIDRMDLVGNVQGSDCIIVDDMIDTAGTLCKAAQHLIDQGARNVYAFSSHGLFNGPANERIKNSALKEVVVVNTIQLTKDCEQNDKIKQLDIAPLLANAIENIHGKKSVSMLFE